MSIINDALNKAQQNRDNDKEQNKGDSRAPAPATPEKKAVPAPAPPPTPAEQKKIKYPGYIQSPSDIDAGEGRQKRPLSRRMLVSIVACLICAGYFVYMFNSTSARDALTTWFYNASSFIKAKIPAIAKVTSTTDSDKSSRPALSETPKPSVRSSAPRDRGPQALSPKLSLDGILFSHESPMVIINDNIYTVGDTVGKAEIVKITESKVFLDFNGREIVLELK